MTGDVLKACGIVIIGLTASLIFREKGKILSFSVASCAFIIVMLFFMRNGLSDAVETISGASESYFPETAKIMLKALGIAYVTSITGEICSAAGENTLANTASFAGKVQIIILCLPLLSQLLKIAGDTL